MNGHTDITTLHPLGIFPKSEISVLIIGAGLGGLTAALECARKGHDVRIFERNPDFNDSGDMIALGLSATTLLRHWPEMREEYDQISLHDAWIQALKHSGTPVAPPKSTVQVAIGNGMDPKSPKTTFQIRPKLYRMLARQLERLGIPVEFGKKVVEYYEDAASKKGGVVEEDGTRTEADVVIAADGIGTKSNGLVGGEVQPRQSGRVMYRASVPIEVMKQDSAVDEFFGLQNGTDSIVRVFLGPGAYAVTLRRKEAMIWLINHDISGTEAESWHNHVSNAEVLQCIDEGGGWAPEFRKMVEVTPPKSIIDFALLWRNPKPVWMSPARRVLQIGDCAHSYLPASGNGATQAMEDGITIAECLRQAGKDGIEEAVGAFVEMRYTRNTCAQKLGFANAELLQHTKWDGGQTTDIKKVAPSMPKWVWQHEPERYAAENFGEVVRALRGGRNFENTNVPKDYEYEPWTIDDIMEDIRDGRDVYLGKGDWQS